jgi:ABC-type nitrate/sulfonate/bicarbonate transport system permease component
MCTLRERPYNSLWRNTDESKRYALMWRFKKYYFFFIEKKWYDRSIVPIGMKSVWTIGASVAVLVVWQCSVMWSGIPHYVLPSPVDVWRTALEDAPLLVRHGMATAMLVVGGLGGGIVCGIVVASALHASAPMRAVVLPLLIGAQNVPLIVIAPFFVIWFGFGVWPKMLLVTGVCFFPIVINTLDGLSRVDPMRARYFAMSGANAWQQFVYLSWPTALPMVFSGCKLAATYSVLGATIAEWVGAHAGLGVYMMFKKASFDVAALFVVVLIVVVASIGLVHGISYIERRCTRWHT